MKFLQVAATEGYVNCCCNCTAVFTMLHSLLRLSVPLLLSILLQPLGTLTAVATAAAAAAAAVAAPHCLAVRGWPGGWCWLLHESLVLSVATAACAKAEVFV
jgi:hypothetical protein